MAAEIGQKLLLQTHSLQRELESLNSEYKKISADPKRANDSSLFIQNLESVNNSLERQIESLTIELNQARDNSGAKIANLDAVNAALDQSREQTSSIQQRCDDLEARQEVLLREKIELSKLVKMSKTSIDAEKETLSSLCQELEKNLLIASKERDEAQIVATSMKSEFRDTLAHCKELEGLLEEYREYREKYEASAGIIEEMGMDLEILQNYTETLKARLAVLEPDGTSADFSGGKTLLGEIEDRRQELESVNAKLLHSNMLSMGDRSRMKAHIQALTVMAANKTSSQTIRPLEIALSQTESEKKQLVETVRELEAKLYNLSHAEHSFSADSQDEIVDCLKIQLHQQIIDSNTMRKELRTAFLLKLSETEKLRQVESLLR